MTMFPATFWHGTSAYLLPLIEEHGLGGWNVLADWRVMAFLEWAFPQLQFDDSIYGDPDYTDLLPIQAAVRGGAAGMNFAYGDIYVTGGYAKAASYAQTAPELISFVKTVVEVADRQGLTSVRAELGGYPEIGGFLLSDPKPIVLKLPPVHSSCVQREDGSTIPSLISGDSSVSGALLSQLAFRIKTVIPFSEIDVLDAAIHDGL